MVIPALLLSGTSLLLRFIVFQQPNVSMVPIYLKASKFTAMTDFLAKT